MTPMLDGPRRQAKRGPARSLVILLHGYGASGDDLIALADMLAPAMPSTAFAAPNAVEEMPYPGEPTYQWFALTALDPATLAACTKRAAPYVEAFIAAELERHTLTPDRLALVGFSQGAMMALEVGLRGRQTPAAIVGLSGVLAGAETLAHTISGRPPVLLSHGSDDEVIPAAALHMTREALAAAGVRVEWHIQPGLGHGIDDVTLAQTANFLKQHLG